MTTPHLYWPHHPLHAPATAVALTGCAVLVLLAATIDYAPRSGFLRVEPALHTQAAPSASLPLTPGDVQNYFAQRLGTAPEQIGRTIVFAQSTTLGDTQDYEVAVTPGSGRLAVEFRGTGPFAIALAKEFFSSSLFRPEESAVLDSMIDRRRESPVAQLPRFKADLRFIESIDLYRLTVSLEPLKN